MSRHVTRTDVNELRLLGVTNQVDRALVLLTDASGDALLATSTTVPSATAGYAKGCLFIDTDVAGGTGGLYENKGTTTSCTFNAVGEVSAGDIADNAVTFAKLVDYTGQGYITRGGAAGAPEEHDASGDGFILVGDGTDLTSVNVNGDVEMTNTGLTTIQPGAVDTAMLAANQITPATLSVKNWTVVAAGSRVSVTGSATQTLEDNNAAANDLGFATLRVTDDTDNLLTVANAAYGVVAVQSADPLAAHAYDYCVLRDDPIVGGEPYHIVAACNETWGGGAANTTVTVTGAVVGDLLMCSLEHNGANDTDLVSSIVSWANTATITFAADPGAGCIINAIALRPKVTGDAATHTIEYAGNFQSVGGDATENITVTGSLATDIAIINQSVNHSQITRYGAAGVDEIIVTMDADPSTDEYVSYMIVRAV